MRRVPVKILQHPLDSHEAEILYEFGILLDDSAPHAAWLGNILKDVRSKLPGCSTSVADVDFDGRDHFVGVWLKRDLTSEDADTFVNSLYERLWSKYRLEES